jgi:hypothetical protein
MDFFSKETESYIRASFLFSVVGKTPMPLVPQTGDVLEV